MLLVPRFFSRLTVIPRRVFILSDKNYQMEKVTSISKNRKYATLRLCDISGSTTELLELRSENPSMHIIFIPGNPGIVAFYKDFLEAIYDLLGENASVTAIGHICQTEKNWEHGKLFSLQDQINHKVDFIKQELQNTEIPILLVGHSIGTYIMLETFKRLPEQVKYAVGLYPFLTLNKESPLQSTIGKISRSQVTCAAISFLAAFFGLFPIWVLRAFVTRSYGQWSSTAVEATCSYLTKYHTVRNILFMTTTEFSKLSEEPDWRFMRERQNQIAFLFGIDDHWGPLSLFEEISKQAPDIALSTEKEGHTHAFSCTEAGSVWVADHVVNLIRHQIPSSSVTGQPPSL